MVNRKSCPICGKEPKQDISTKWMLVSKCGNPLCGHLYSAEELPDRGIQKHPYPSHESKLYQERNKRLVRYWCDTGLIGEGSAVMDYGAGAGHIALAMREFAGVRDITCVEADSASREYLRRNNFNVVDQIKICSRTFDAILLIEVIEHIDDPLSLFGEIKAHLKPGGKLFLSTPCGETRSSSRKTNAYDTPEHIHFFTELSLAMALKSAGFENVEFRTVLAMYPRGKGFFGLLTAQFKGWARILRDKIRGYSHLVVVAS